MAEIAEGIIEGLFCSQCCGYVDGEAVGFQRLCDSCKEDDRPRRRKKHHRKNKNNKAAS